jgi:hypothetical protein
MEVEEFIRVVATEPGRVVKRTVFIPEAEMVSKASRPGGLNLADLLSTRGRRTEQRDLRYEHVLGPPAAADAIEAWQRQHSVPSLPPDLCELMLRMNGIHLWARSDMGRAYVGLAPIEEWELARTKIFGRMAEESLLDDRYVAITYHGDGASYVAVDVKSGRYYLMDAAGPDTSAPIANSAGELLDWLWQRRIPPEG